MIYALAVLTFAMLGFMFWSTTFRLRRDRLRFMKSSSRRRIVFRARQRVRATLKRAFALPEQKAEWEAGLLASLRARERD